MNEQHPILVVEDNHDLRVCMRQVLEEAGFAVTSSTNGKDALTQIKNGQLPKVIILDLNMPIMSGEEFLKELKQEVDVPLIPTLLVSGDLERLIPLKDYSHLLKPVVSEELIARVDAYVGR